VHSVQNFYTVQFFLENRSPLAARSSKDLGQTRCNIAALR
jgi:hypothetical protein